MNAIVALWTHPRSISTAFERVMMERKDFIILHEPFSYLYYVKKDASAISQQYIDPNHPTAYPDIRDYILAAAEKGPVFFKDMCAHCRDELLGDDAFLKRLDNTFLIRDPAKAIASFYAMNPDVKLDEIGLNQLADVFDRSLKIMDKTPPVVDADDLEDHPEATVAAYCKAVGIRHIPEALQWDSGEKEEWEIWKDWHADAARSTGIQKNMETFEVTVENSEHLKSYYDHQMPFYRKMYDRRLKPVAD